MTGSWNCGAHSPGLIHRSDDVLWPKLSCSLVCLGPSSVGKENVCPFFVSQEQEEKRLCISLNYKIPGQASSEVIDYNDVLCLELLQTVR